MDDLIAAIVGALVTLTLAGFGFVIRGFQEHNKWKRERKYDAYMLFFYELSRIFDWTSDVMHFGRTDSTTTREEAEGIWRMSAAVNMHLPEKLDADFEIVMTYLGDLTQWARNTLGGILNPDQFHELHSANKEVLDRLTEAMKKDLKI